MVDDTCYDLEKIIRDPYVCGAIVVVLVLSITFFEEIKKETIHSKYHRYLLMGLSVAFFVTGMMTFEYDNRGLGMLLLVLGLLSSVDLINDGT